MNYVRLKRGYIPTNNGAPAYVKNCPRIIPLLSTEKTVRRPRKNSISITYLKVFYMLYAYNNNKLIKKYYYSNNYLL